MKRSHIKFPAFIKQQGVALMVMMIILVLGTLAILANSLGGANKTIQRDEKTANALNQAREALIAYAVSNADRPGNLPCPDRHLPSDANYGMSSSPCSNSGKTSIGRLPWKELGIPELFDSSGQSLWYALSDNFRTTAGVINSNTPGTLSMFKSSTLMTSSWDQGVAVVFAPGTAIGNQSRSTTQTSSCSTTGTTIVQFLCAANYLESSGGGNNATASGPYVSADKDQTFNDQVIHLPASQLMNNVEKRVARELKGIFNNYYASWSAFPFAAPFTSPPSSSYSGATGTYYGLLPLNSLIEQDTNRPAWNGDPTISFSDGGHYLNFCERRNGDWNDSRWRCCKNSSSCSSTVTIPSGVTVTITGRLNHVGKGIWDPYDSSDTNQVRVKDNNGDTVTASSILDNVSITSQLNQTDGSAIITFSARGKSGGSQLQRIELRDITSPAASLPNWFAANDWREVMIYALSPGYAPGGTPTCSPYCIAVNNQTASAVIAATGASLSTQTHPSGSWTNYMEGVNVTPASGLYANGTLSSDFNDKIISIAP